MNSPKRLFDVSQPGHYAPETIEAHYMRVGNQGELDFFVEAGGGLWSIRTFAAGSWTSVESDPPTQEQLDRITEEYKQQLSAAQQEKMAFAQMANLGAGLKGN